MNNNGRLCDVLLVFLFVLCLQQLQCSKQVFHDVDEKYHLVSEAYKLAKNLFIQGRTNYDMLKNTSLVAIDTFLDLVFMMNKAMAKELRSAIIKFYKIKYFRDFTNYVISMEEMVEITDHCLVNPIEKLDLIREHFRNIVHNFEDVRNFQSVEMCREELPDEVAAAHCILHQAVLFNETMQTSLVSIVKIKTRQHAQDMKTSLFNVQKCFNNFVPKFFDQLLINAYTDNCGYLKIVNATVTDIIKDKWKINQTMFPGKWGPLLTLFREKSTNSQKLIDEPLFVTLFDANLTSYDIYNTLYS